MVSTATEIFMVLILTFNSVLRPEHAHNSFFNLKLHSSTHYLINITTFPVCEVGSVWGAPPAWRPVCSAEDIFLSPSTAQFLRQGFSMNQELPVLGRLAGYQVLGSACPFLHQHWGHRCTSLQPAFTANTFIIDPLLYEQI